MLLRPIRRFFAQTAVVKKPRAEIVTAANEETGSLYTWGESYYGRLTGSIRKNASGDTPVNMGEIKNVTRVTAGANHLLVHTNDSKLFGLGLNSNGQLGNGDRKDATQYPVQVLSGLKTRDVAAGKGHSVVVLDNGTVLMSGGLGLYGKLDEYKNTGNKFTQLSSFGNKGITHVTAGNNFSLALSSDHKVYGWGSPWKGKLPIHSGQPFLLEDIDRMQHRYHSHVVKMKSIGNASMILLDNGKAFAFGQESFGNIGVRSNELVQESFVYDEPTQVCTDNLHGEQIVDFDLSTRGSVFLTHSNKVYFSGFQAASKPTLLPTQTGNVKKVFVTSKCVGYVTVDNKIHTYVDRLVQDSDQCPKSLMYLCEDVNLEGNVIDIGGPYKLNYAVIG